jgi:hypothetical protein
MAHRRNKKETIIKGRTSPGKDFFPVAFAVDDPQHQYFFGRHKAIENNIRAHRKAAITRPDFIAPPP